jgi:uncharacterized protein
MMNTYVVFHSKKVKRFRPCMDGIFSAAIANNALKIAILNPILIPAEYGNPPVLNLRENDVIYLLDLSYPYSVLQQWTDAGAEVRMIDHHKSAKKDLDGWLNSRFDSVFDMSKSGAMLTWEYFNPDEAPPEVVRYVQDRDIWTKALPGCDLCSLGLSEAVHKRSLYDCLQIATTALEMNSVEHWISEGRKVHSEIQKAIGNAVSRAKWRIIGGWNVPTVRVQGDRECQAYSDIGNALLTAFPKAPFACVLIGDGFALRSDNNRVDVEIVAKSIGGGGHRNASGSEGDDMLLRWKRSQD